MATIQVKKTLLILVVFMPLLVALPATATQTDEQEIVQTGVHAILAVDNEAGTITAVIGAGYEGNTEEFTWLFAVPGEPLSVEFATPEFLRELQGTYPIRIDAPLQYCQLVTTQAEHVAPAISKTGIYGG